MLQFPDNLYGFCYFRGALSFSSMQLEHADFEVKVGGWAVSILRATLCSGAPHIHKLEALSPMHYPVRRVH